MITSVKLRNWKSHLDSELRFDKGVNALIGIMGSGKSSVLDAVAFGLFGTFPTLQTKKIVLDDLIMKRPQEKQTATIEIDFQIDGVPYSVKREITRGKRTSHAEIRKAGELKEVNPKGVTEEVGRILQMDYDLFAKAVYSEQNALDYFLKIPKGQRMSHIDRMLKVDRFDKAREGANQIHNKLKATIDEKNKFIADLEKENLDEEITELEKQVTEMEKRFDTVKEQLERMIKERQEVAEKVSLFEEKEKQYNEMKQFLEGVKGRLTELQHQATRRKQAIGGLQIETLQADIDMLVSSLEIKKEEVENKKKELYSYEAQRKLALESLKNLEDLSHECPVCRTDITGQKKEDLIKHNESEMTTFETKIKQLTEDITKKETNIQEEEKTLRELQFKKQHKEKAQQEIETLEKEMDIIVVKEQSYREKIKIVTKEVEEGQLQDIRKQLQEKVAQQRALLTERDGLEQMKTDKKNHLKQLVKRNDLLKKYKRDVEKEEQAASMLSRFIVVLKTTQDQLREEFLKTVNAVMSQVWAALYPYGDYQDIRLFIDKDYVLELQSGNEWVAVDGIVSGGERTIACLALRIAFSLAFIPNLRWLILDEPTHNLDQNAIRHFADILAEKMHQFAEQIFLITHEEGLSDGITGKLYRLERDKSINEPTKVLGL